MKIGFAARWSPLDKKSWSGTTHFTYRRIQQYYETEIFQYKWPWHLREWLTMQKSLNRKLFGKQTAVEFLKAYAKDCSKHLEKELKERPVDLLFVSGSPQMISYIETEIPIIFMIDATFKQLNGYYPYYSNLPAYNLRQGIALDKKAFENATHCLLTSDWVKASAIRDYQIAADKISLIPFAANLDTIPAFKDKQVETGSCRLLFLGVEWERKGGPIALETFRLLQQKGLHPTLHIIGCIPPEDLSAEKNIRVIPFLDKNNPEALKKLETIIADTDLLLVPTRAECAGVVFSEASAYGIPSISTDTGGVGSIIRNGVNGFLLPAEAQADAYAEKIVSICNTPGYLQAFRKSSRDYYDQHLSWELWGKQFCGLVDKLTGRPA